MGINYCQVVNSVPIEESLYNRLDRLGMIPNETRKTNVGNSNYAKHLIQPWSIWIDYNLNAWDADIVKRVLRTKSEPGISEKEARIMDYNKIIHICKERIRQLEFEPTITSTATWDIPTVTIDSALLEEASLATLATD